ncbi:hypothetical protein [Streptomyces sp. NPDC056660]|uniref:hypothetical protein n=1 Tax=Streptomyces sp. NPDC056660 TaxID=3345897 RepID=UPI0036775409
MLTFTDDGFKDAIQKDTGIRPPWAAEAFADLDTDVRQSIARTKADPFVAVRAASCSAVRHTTLTGCRTTASNR